MSYKTFSCAHYCCFSLNGMITKDRNTSLFGLTFEVIRHFF